MQTDIVGVQDITTDADGITVLLCCFNSEQRLHATLSALARQKIDKDFQVEILIVDNASTDNTFQVADEVCRQPSFPYSYRVLQEARVGKTNAIELGFEQSKYKYVAIVDDDNWLAPDYLNSAWKILESNAQIGALGGVGEAVCEVAPPAWFTDYAIDYAAARQDKESGDVTSTSGFIFGAGCVIRRDAWRLVQAAGFKSQLVKYPGIRSSGEDIEMCYALTLAGYRIWFDERLRFQHYIPASRLTWAYVCSLYESNAGSEVDLRPYRHFLQQMGATGPFAWLRNGVYISRYFGKHFWRAFPASCFHFATPAEGNREALLAIYFRRVIQHYFTKEIKKDKGFERIAAFINRLRTFPG